VSAPYATRVALIGPGRMGGALRRVAPEHGVEVVAELGREEMGSGAGAVARALDGVDVALEFTRPDAAVENIRACVGAACPVVVGTSGWYDRLDEVEEIVRHGDGSVLWASNFSVGYALLRAAAGALADLGAGLADYDVHIVETHHAAKLDAPSGTAVSLRAAISDDLGRPVEVTSVRVGRVPGTHEVVVDGPFEQIVLRHEVRERRVFADGAVRAALWLKGRRGLFTFDDVLREVAT
jgi:4-hydroxy-tetrahydrodipicolinate reductase